MDIKIWEGDAMSFERFRNKVMEFCYDNRINPDGIFISPYTESAPCGTITEMGIRLSLTKGTE